MSSDTIIIPDPPGGDPSADMELQINRDNTAAFIAADPVELILTRVVKDEDGAGGYKNVKHQMPNSQRFRMIPSNDRMPEVIASNGTYPRPEYTLLGEWDADLMEDDEFEFQEVVYKIINPVRPVHTDKAYERKGDVIRRERV